MQVCDRYELFVVMTLIIRYNFYKYIALDYNKNKLLYKLQQNKNNIIFFSLHQQSKTIKLTIIITTIIINLR